LKILRNKFLIGILCIVIGVTVGFVLLPKSQDADMFWSTKYNGYAYLVLVGENAELLAKETAAPMIGAAKATATEIGYDGNVNKSATGNVDVNDAQLVYDFYNAKYSDLNDQVTIDKMLRADMNANADKATYGLTVSDVAAVMAIVNAK